MRRRLSKIALRCAAAGLTVVLSACAAGRRSVALAPVGPPPLAHATRAHEGRLMVYSALDIGIPGGRDYVHYHSGYRIYSVDGKPLKYIANRVGASEEPGVVSLPPGRYTIVARAAAFGTVTVPVVIEAGKTTSVHLDGSEPIGSSENSESRFVSLPDGLIIDWRAKDEGREK